MIARLNSFVAIVAAACMFLMMVLTIADATGRYVFSAPIEGSVEYIAYLLGVLVFAGYAMVTRDRSHIVVGMIAEMLPAWYRRAEEIVSALITFAATGVIVWMTISQAGRFWHAGLTGEATHISVGGLVYVLAVFGAIAAVFALLNAYKVIVRPESVAPADYHHTP